jgi:hypothetical protein
MMADMLAIIGETGINGRASITVSRQAEIYGEYLRRNEMSKSRASMPE